ncbi:molybdenum cofactor biosynthesis protein MoaE [Motilibacter aurantiacus]|uniref:molybdenum cofactor biosynthesis protein MoaE n=1 Tax=Motilibacter aurantiacus TaxID=2714955 RepID=UPI00140D28AA|nr:molybdenum cofactor biosynthesis protein MoaE [Motilibacter aurantiacus]NHC45642.1 molybdenum cofactor biosynthesis protein MoaE [Motilibacter aurantiacus]
MTEGPHSVPAAPAAPPAPTAGSGPAGEVRLVAVRDTALSVDEVLAAVASPGAGGIVTFLGAVRDTDGGRAVTGLGYSAHPSAEQALREVAAEAAAVEGVRAVAVVHRQGDLVLGDLAVVAAVAAAHRQQAFAACARLIDELKARAPIWKHQLFADGGEEWVGSP